MNRKFSNLTSVILGLIFCTLTFVQAQAKDIALLIGVTSQDSSELQNPAAVSIENEINTIKSRMKEGTSCAFEVTTLTGEQCTLASIRATLKNFLASSSTSNSDTVFVYFSGQGIPSTSDPGKILLAVKDSNPADESTFLPAQEISDQLSCCAGAGRVFLLDICNAKEAVDFQAIPTPKVITLAYGSKYNTEEAWTQKTMANISYWFDEALKGYADEDSDGWLDTEELTNYITENLERNVHLEHPVLFKSEGTPHAVFFKPAYRMVYSIIDDFAEQILLYASLDGITSIQTNGFKPMIQTVSRSTVPVLTDESHLEKIAHFCTQELARRVELKSQGKVHIGANEAKPGASMNCWIDEKEKFYNLNGIFMFTDAGSQKASRDPIHISQRLHVKAALETPASNISTDNYIESLVGIEVKDRNGVYKQRKIHNFKGQYYVALDEGEVYAVLLKRFEQPGENPIHLGTRIFVDGRSTLPQRLSDVEASNFQVAETPVPKFFIAGPEEQNSPAASETSSTPDKKSVSSSNRMLSSAGREYAPAVPTDVSMFFVLNDGTDSGKYNLTGTHKFKGFLKTIGDAAEYREFLVLPESQKERTSEAGGMISVGIYQLVKTAVTRSTGDGNLGITQAPVVNGLAPASLLQKITIHYISSKKLREYSSSMTDKSTLWAK